MKLHLLALAAALCAARASACDDCAPDATPRTTTLGLVRVDGAAATSLPTLIPTTLEGVTAADIARHINATDAEDALKYLPSLMVRKRYAGDYNHAVLSTRASGSGNSARALVFVDGIPLANLLGNGAAFTPRWGLIGAEEIARVDVLYGPFSAAYSGNSVGAVVDYQTRRPQAFEAHAEAGLHRQRWRYGGDDSAYPGWHASAALGDQAGAWSWRLSLARHDNAGQPLTFATRPIAAAAPAATALPVSGAVAGLDRFGQAQWLLGSAAQMHTVQDQARLRLSWQARPGLRVQALLGLWRNSGDASSQSWLRDAAGNAVTTGPVAIDGRGYTLAANEFGLMHDEAEHRIAGATLKQTGADLNWELAASRYDYAKDRSAQPLARSGGPGRITRLGGSGWSTLAAKASIGGWEGGLQREHHAWRQRVDNATDWLTEGRLTPFTVFNGETTLTSAFAQRVLDLAPELRAVLGLRHETWAARDGSKTSSDGKTVTYARRRETALSPKAALGWAAGDALDLRISLGRAVRWPTVGELFQGGLGSTGAYVDADPVTNPGLRAERGWTRELSALWRAPAGELRATLFHEDMRDALYSQSSVVNGKTVGSVQNIGRIETLGLELAGRGAIGPALRWQASLTHADSTIKENTGFVATAGDTLGKQQPRVPRWRASTLLSWAVTPTLDASLGARYGSRPYGSLNNADVNGMAYQGFSPYFTADVKLAWRIDRQWSASLGVDNLNDAEYWNFHPYPGRTVLATLRFDR